MWAIAPGHDSTVALNRGYGAQSSDDLILDQDALARNEIDAMVAMLAMVIEGNGAIVAMVAMDGASPPHLFTSTAPNHSAASTLFALCTLFALFRSVASDCNGANRPRCNNTRMYNICEVWARTQR